MVRKLQKIARDQAAAPGLLDNELAGAVRDSAQQIWLAGMGAFAKAQAQGGKVFEKLVKEGVSLQRRTQAVAEERIGDVAGKMTAMADGVTTKAGQKWDRLESIFEQRVEKALRKLGVPSSRDTDALIRRIDALHAQVEALRTQIANIEGLIADLRTEMTQESLGGASLAAKNTELRLAEENYTFRTLEVQQALTQMEAARIEANRQVRYLSLGVEPVAPDEATYPRAFENTVLAFLVFAGLYLMVSLTASILREQVTS